MPRKTRALSGAAQDAYFRRVLKTCASLSAEERDHVVRRLRQEIAQLRLRVVLAPAGQPELPQAPLPAEPARSPDPEPAAVTCPTPFDPYSPNVIVVLRKGGRDAALRALNEIDCLDNLRLLAREQRLSVSAELCSAAELRAAIVAAAERRVANRLAAAS
jgi:hypothetical protein